jgi:hypothetical protein
MLSAARVASAVLPRRTAYHGSSKTPSSMKRSQYLWTTDSRVPSTYAVVGGAEQISKHLKAGQGMLQDADT